MQATSHYTLSDMRNELLALRRRTRDQRWAVCLKGARFQLQKVTVTDKGSTVEPMGAWESLDKVIYRIAYIRHA